MRIAVKMCMVVAHGFMTIAQWACVILVGCGLIPFLLGKLLIFTLACVCIC